MDFRVVHWESLVLMRSRLLAAVATILVTAITAPACYRAPSASPPDASAPNPDDQATGGSDAEHDAGIFGDGDVEIDGGPEVDGGAAEPSPDDCSSDGGFSYTLIDDGSRLDLVRAFDVSGRTLVFGLRRVPDAGGTRPLSQWSTAWVEPDAGEGPVQWKDLNVPPVMSVPYNNPQDNAVEQGSDGGFAIVWLDYSTSPREVHLVQVSDALVADVDGGLVWTDPLPSDVQLRWDSEDHEWSVWWSSFPTLAAEPSEERMARGLVSGTGSLTGSPPVVVYGNATVVLSVVRGGGEYLLITADSPTLRARELDRFGTSLSAGAIDLNLNTFYPYGFSGAACNATECGFLGAPGNSAPSENDTPMFERVRPGLGVVSGSERILTDGGYHGAGVTAWTPAGWHVGWWTGTEPAVATIGPEGNVGCIRMLPMNGRLWSIVRASGRRQYLADGAQQDGGWGYWLLSGP